MIQRSCPIDSFHQVTSHVAGQLTIHSDASSVGHVADAASVGKDTKAQVVVPVVGSIDSFGADARWANRSGRRRRRLSRNSLRRKTKPARSPDRRIGDRSSIFGNDATVNSSVASIYMEFPQLPFWRFGSLDWLLFLLAAKQSFEELRYQDGAW